MKAKIAIISLRFNPAFIQHLIAYAKAARELGHEPEFVLDPAYRDFPELNLAVSHYETSTNTPTVAWRCAIFLNPSLKNQKLARALKQEGSKIFYVYHEPWQMSLDYLWSEGLVGTLKAIVAHHVTVPALRLADTVMVPSQYGLDKYQHSDARYNANGIYLPLMYDDEGPSAIAGFLLQKQYFGYIGSLCRSHGFDQYLSFIRYALQRDLRVSFLIASRNPLPVSITSDPLFSRNPERVKIRCGKPLGNDEINRCYAESICVWNLYRRSTQSGVLPKAFMFGTPVIAENIGSFPEFTQDGLNGRFASARDHEGIWIAFEEIRSNIAAYAANSRRTFLETFYYRARLADLRRLLD